MTAAQHLPDQWRERAALLRRYNAEGQAVALEQCAAELEANEREAQLRLVTLREAVEITGLSYSALEKKVRTGALPNGGAKHHPRLRVGDLPRKAGQKALAPEGPDLVGRILAHSSLPSHIV